MNRSRLIMSLLIVLTLVSSSGTTQFAQEATTPAPLVVHEWGTFTSIAGEDGKAVKWRAFNGSHDLPGFVYSLNGLSAGLPLSQSGGCAKCAREGTVRMETPVLYFYADRELTVSVKVAFPQGTITEWYPQARNVTRGIDWGEVTVLPNAAVELPFATGENHYYAARQTDAAPLRVRVKEGEQYEKFLFYRGIGNFAVPLSARLEANQVFVKRLGAEALGQVILFENRGGQVSYQLHDLSAGEIVAERSMAGRSLQQLRQELQRLLIEQGLYETEAHAMLETWRDSWFEEGLRIFYLFPRQATDEILPLSLDPMPVELIRVLVGRIEIITPEMEKAVADTVASFPNDAENLPTMALELTRKHGRFVVPILKRLGERTKNAQNREFLSQLANHSLYLPN